MVAHDQWDAAMKAWWEFTEEIAPLVVAFLNRQTRRAVSVICATVPRASKWGDE